MNVIIDLEFTGLDNTYVCDNEITQVKMACVETGHKLCRNCKVTKPVSVYDRLKGVRRYSGRTAFSQGLFTQLLDKMGTGVTYWGYSVEQDLKMLRKYGIEIAINDLQEKIRLNPKYEHDMAVGTASLEGAYYLLTGEVPKLPHHHDDRELDVLLAIFRHIEAFTKEERNRYFTLMPWGHCAGMPISEYVQKYRRAADGYRYNNNDLLSKSLTRHIPTPVYCYVDDAWDVDSDEVDDELDE